MLIIITGIAGDWVIVPIKLKPSGKVWAGQPIVENPVVIVIDLIPLSDQLKC